MLAVAVLAVGVTIFRPWSQREQRSEPGAQSDVQPVAPAEEPSETAQSGEPPQSVQKTILKPPTVSENSTNSISSDPFAGLSNNLERLNRIRETFAALAAGNPTNAMRAVKDLTNETERETALLALVTQWTQGHLGPSRDRAYYVTTYGIEAGLGIELAANNPDLAVLWANELTEGEGRAAMLRRTAAALVASDPASAFALGNQLPAEEQRKFLDAVFAGWATSDTDAALKWADQIQDPADHDAALAAIRTMAPVGIGAALSIQDGYPVINELFPGTPAEQSGQIHPGDRIVALGQGDNTFVDTRGLPLKQIVDMVRGAPNTTLQMQVLAGDAGPEALPRTISILRNQLKFKR